MGAGAADEAIGRRGVPSVADVAPIIPQAQRVLPRCMLQELMSHHVGLHRTAAGLRRVAAALREAPVVPLRTRTDQEDAALTLVAAGVCAAALARTESRGAHSRADHPEADDDQARSATFVLSPAGDPVPAAAFAGPGLAL